MGPIPINHHIFPRIELDLLARKGECINQYFTLPNKEVLIDFIIHAWVHMCTIPYVSFPHYLINKMDYIGHKHYAIATYSDSI